MDNLGDGELHARLLKAFATTPTADPPPGLAERAMLRIRLDRIERDERDRFRTRLAQGAVLAAGAAASLAAIAARALQGDAWEWSIPGGRGAADYLVASVGDWGSLEAAATVLGAAVVGVCLLALGAVRPSRIGHPTDR